METATIQHLLSTVSALSKKYDEINRLTGMNFNIFSIMDMETSEVKLHSAFIAELLSTDGSHNCGNTFLEIFVRQQNEKIAKRKTDGEEIRLSLDIPFAIKDRYRAIREKYIGPISSDYSKGGQIDILVEDSTGKPILIFENKINAQDQKNQLIRYQNFGGKTPILYLTKDGESPHECSIGKELKNNEHFLCISYKNDIISWLNECCKEASRYPLLRETISQYITTVKNITNQSINVEMSKELSELIAKDLSSFSASIAIREAVLGSYAIVVDKIIMGIQKNIEGHNFSKETDSTSIQTLSFKRIDKCSFSVTAAAWNHEIKGLVTDDLNQFRLFVIPDANSKESNISENILTILTNEGIETVVAEAIPYIRLKYWESSNWPEVYATGAETISDIIKKLAMSISNSESFLNPLPCQSML